MKRSLNGEEVHVATGSVQSPVIDWTQQDRQPGWQDKQPNGQAEDSDPDGDGFILESRRRQQRLVTPEKSDGGDLEPPGAPVKKKRRVLPWTLEGRERWPLASTCLFSRSTYDDDGVVQVEDSVDDNGSETVDDCSSFGGEEKGDDDGDDGSETVDDCSSFVVDDDSESVVDEECVSERELGRIALVEVRASIVENMAKLKRRLDFVDKELSVLEDDKDDDDDDDDALSFAVFREKNRKMRLSK
jgi:hypothetical protein